MDQLCEPIEVNRKFHELLTKLKQDIDQTYVSDNKILKKDIIK